MSIGSYIIREAIPSDAKGITIVHVKSWETSYKGIVDQSYLDTISFENRLAFRKEVLQSKNILHLVAMFEEHVVGFADAGKIRAESRIGLYPEQKNVGEVYAIYLLEEHKGKGCGKSLFDRCRIWLDQQGFELFVVRALSENVRAKHFYEREGGKKIGETSINIGEKQYQEDSYLFSM